MSDSEVSSRGKQKEAGPRSQEWRHQAGKWPRGSGPGESQNHRHPLAVLQQWARVTTVNGRPLARAGVRAHLRRGCCQRPGEVAGPAKDMGESATGAGEPGKRVLDVGDVPREELPEALGASGRSRKTHLVKGISVNNVRSPQLGTTAHTLHARRPRLSATRCRSLQVGRLRLRTLRRSHSLCTTDHATLFRSVPA